MLPVPPLFSFPHPFAAISCFPSIAVIKHILFHCRRISIRNRIIIIAPVQPEIIGHSFQFAKCAVPPVHTSGSCKCQSRTSSLLGPQAGSTGLPHCRQRRSAGKPSTGVLSPSGAGPFFGKMSLPYSLICPAHPRFLYSCYPHYAWQSGSSFIRHHHVSPQSLWWFTFPRPKVISFYRTKAKKTADRENPPINGL